MNALRIGDLEVTPLSDGWSKLPPTYFDNADWGPHQALLGADGLFEIPFGCFLIRSRDQTILVDTGVGPIDLPVLHGGDLPEQLRLAGVAPADIDLVVCTHLHADHVGWLVRDDRPFFERATVRFGAGDWQQFVLTEVPADADTMSRLASEMTRNTMRVLEAADRLAPIDADGPVAPGITSMHAPGHTLGHLCLILASGTDRALLLGDAVTCPVQLEEPDWQVTSDIDPALAARTREALWRELEGTDTAAVASHFPGLQFGRVLRGQGKRYFS